MSTVLVSKKGESGIDILTVALSLTKQAIKNIGYLSNPMFLRMRLAHDGLAIL